jgi:D-threo-aldose 1-dehydrogenase
MTTLRAEASAADWRAEWPAYGMGTAALGNLYEEVDEDRAVETVLRAYEAGLRRFDTAPLYGFGLAEARLGRAVRAGNLSDVSVATKVGRLLRPADHPDAAQRAMWKGVPDDVDCIFDFSRDGAYLSLEESVRRLGVDRIDTVFIHDPDDHFAEAIAGAYPALHELRDDGVVQAIGVGMNQASLLARFAREGDFDCFLVAGRYTLLDQTALDELLPLCEARGIAVIIGGVYNSGVLAHPTPGATFDYQPAMAGVVARAKALNDVCARHGVPLKAAALQFPLAHPAVRTVLLGPRSPAELEDNLRMTQVSIPADLWSELRHEGLLPEHAPVPS